VEAYLINSSDERETIQAGKIRAEIEKRKIIGDKEYNEYHHITV
jgi:hypothetical protein